MPDLIYIASLLLTLTFANNAFISTMNPKHFTYLESFFVLGYVTIGMIVLFIALYTKRALGDVLVTNESLLLRLLFWPVFTAVCMLVSLIWFYP